MSYFFLIALTMLLTIQQTDSHDNSVGKHQHLNVSGQLNSELKSSNGACNCKLDLGELETDSEYLVFVAIKNPFKEDIHFDEVKMSCGCGQFVTDQTYFPAGGELKGTLEYNSPESNQNAKTGFDFQFKSEEETIVAVFAQCKLRNNLFIVNPGPLSIQGKNEREWMVPIVFSEPIVKNDLKVEVSESIVAKELELVKKDGIDLIHLKVSPKDLAGTHTFGKLKLIHSPTGKMASRNIVISKKPLVSISPALLRFRQKPGSSLLKASAMVRLEKEFVGNSDPEKLNALISCRWQNEKLTVKKQRLTPTIYRLEIVGSKLPQFRASELNEMGWGISVSGRKFETTTKFHVEGDDDD